MFESNNVHIIHYSSSLPSEFARNSLIHYQELYQVRFQDEYSCKYNSGDSYYFYYVNYGSVFFTINDKIYTLTQNDLLLIKKNVDITITSSDAEIYYVEFQGNQVDKYVNELVPPSKSGINMVDFSSISMFLIRLKELSMSETLNEVYVSLNIEAILVEIYTKKVYGGDGESKSNVIIQAIFYIEQNVSNKITLQKLCDFVGYSVFHFSRVFKKEVGMAPYEYIIKFRLDLAKHLLITTNETVREIARKCGYTSEVNFYNVFKKNMGVTPKQFRKLNIEKEN